MLDGMVTLIAFITLICDNPYQSMIARSALMQVSSKDVFCVGLQPSIWFSQRPVISLKPGHTSQRQIVNIAVNESARC
jgi:hypothetical protein